jgi:parvulin-like peptidyl-prolyl isomerase
MIFSLLGLMLAQQPTAPAPTTTPQTQPPLPTISMTAPLPPDPNKVVETINGQKIYARDVAGYVYQWSIGRTMEAIKNLTLMQQEADRRGIKVTDAEIRTRIEGQLQQVRPRVPKGQDFETFLIQQGYPISYFVVYFKAQLLLEKMADADFKPDQYVKYGALMIRPKDETTASLSAALTSANTAYAELKRGGAWDNVLKKYATIETTTTNGGDRGWLPISALPAESQKAAISAKAMDFLPPVKDENGIEIFRIEAKGKDATATELTDLKQRMLPYIERSIITDLQAKAKIETSF